MELQKAQEIAASPVMATVTYQGQPIYIQSVDASKETVRIYPLNQPGKEQEVPVHTLQLH